MTPDDDPKRELSFTAWLLLYFSLLAFVFGVPFLIAPYFGMRVEIGWLGLSGGLSLLAATRHPWWLYETLRSVRGWGIGLPDGHVQLYLAVLGVLGLGLAVLGAMYGE